MKTLQWAAAVLAVGALALPARAETTTTNDWWNVTFEPGSFKEGFPGLTVGELGTLTNDEAKAEVTQPYASGVWSMIDGDESYVTNQYNPTNVPAGSFGQDYCIKLDTQGNDLTWTPTGTVDTLSYLVDADLYLVGSDSAPDATDFDAENDVQAAIYLKNETDEDTGETTNSVLCVYVENVLGQAYWQELKGVELEDNSWAHVQVLVNHTDTSDPKVSVYVNGVQMSARDGADTDNKWTIANSTSDNAKTHTINSVAFRGTGAVDNFAGKALETSFEQAYFKAVVYLNDSITNELCQVTQKKLDIGGPELAKFDGFFFDDLQVNPTVSYTLTKIEIEDFQTGSTRTYLYEYDIEDEFMPLKVLTPTPDIFFETEGEDDEVFQTGEFWVRAFTGGATLGADPDEPITIVRIYFENLPEEGTFNAEATTTIAGTTTTDARKVRPSEFAEPGATKTVTWEFPAEKDGNLLSTVQVYGGATLTYADKTATVSVTLDAALAADTLFAAATYVEGSLLDGQDLRYTYADGTYTFAAYTPPVAIIVAEVEGVTTTNEYSSLRAAIAAAAAGETVYLVADDRVSFSAEDTEIVIGKALTIDGGSNTLYGVSGYAYDGVNDHDIFIGAAAGDVTFKNLKISEFSDTAPTVQYRTYPIWTSQAYAGKLTLDGVTIDKFARTAVNLGNGTFEITNCVIAGYAGSETAPANYFQNAITLLDAKGTVAETTVTGIGTHEGSKWGAGLVTFNKDGNGEVTFLSGSYTADFVIEVSSNATGKVVISNGTFVATAPAEDEGEAVSAFQFDEEAADRTLTVTIAGGWFDREPEAAFIAAGLAAKEVAPGTAAPWTVGQTFTITFNDEDGSELYKTNGVFTGETGYGPATDPTKAETDAATYAFAGWTNAVAGGAAVATADLPAADADATWTAVYAATPKHYLVTFLNGEETFSTTNAAYGETGYGPATDPTKAETAQYSYAFEGWTNAVAGGAAVATADLPPVEGEATWTAVFSETVKTYDVEWIVDGTYTTNTWAYNATPSYGENDPTKESTAATNFTFAGWSPAVVAVTGPGASYTATWTETVRQYWILWSVDGTVTSNQVAYGETPAYPGEAPSKEGYAFLGWNSDPTATTALATLPTVEGTATYYAVFEEESAVHVNPGDGLDTIANAPAPIEFTAAGLCKIAFKAPAAGKYVLMTSTTVNGTYQAEGTPVEYAKDDLVVLTEASAATTKFFKIGYEK